MRQSVAAGREALKPGRRPLLPLAQLLQHGLGEPDLGRRLRDLCAAAKHNAQREREREREKDYISSSHIGLIRISNNVARSMYRHR